MIVLDTECYKNYFLIMFKEIETEVVKYFELTPDTPISVAAVEKIMKNHTTISFNGISYDLPLIQAAIEGFDNQSLKKVSDKIIKSNRPYWSICKDNNIVVPHEWDHIDLIEITPGFASLKLYAGRMGMRKMQNLPIEPDEFVSPELHEDLRNYCENDLEITETLYHRLKSQIDLRILMSEQYGIDLRSKSDAQIAEAVIKKELQDLTPNQCRFFPKKEKEDFNKTINYQNPKIVSFDTPELNRIFDKILNHDFELQGNGNIKLPKGLKELKISIGERQYQVGIGGLHSCEKSQLVDAGDEILCEFDVASYYPSIILQQQLYPKTMGKAFLELYQNMITDRLKAKENAQKIKQQIDVLENKLAKMETKKGGNEYVSFA